MTIRSILLATALLAASSTAALAESDDVIAAPVLRASVAVSGDVVRIGDVIDNAGTAAQIAIYRAPDLGTTGMLPTAQVISALRAHQVIGANVQGATMMSETLAQYSALMVMKHKFGDAKMKRFLKYELDSYLVNRGAERKAENPLYRNENQGYIHYRKGSLAMYALQDAIGEDAVNRALAAYIKKVAYQEPPYTISRELLAEFRVVTPPEYQYLIGDLFETITLYENRALAATYKDEGNGRYEVTLKVSAKKVRSDGIGAQTEVPMDDQIDIGVLGEGDAPLYLKKRRVRSGETTFTMEVSGKPLRAGIDPIVKLIDRRPDDNTIAVTKAE